MKSGPFQLSDLQHRELQSQKTGEKYSFSAPFNDLFGFKDVFIHHEIIPPGRRASASHTHSNREEMIFVLEGMPTAHYRGQDYLLKPGDFMAFLPGAENFHFLANNADTPAKVLVIASNPKHDDVTYS